MSNYVNEVVVTTSEELNSFGRDKENKIYIEFVVFTILINIRLLIFQLTWRTI